MAENTAGDSAELSVVLSRIADKADTAMTQVAALIDSLEQRAERAEGERDGWKLEAERLDELNKSANASNAFKSAQVDRIVIEEAAATKAARDATKAVKAELAIATAQVESLAASVRQTEAERDALREDAERWRWLQMKIDIGDVPWYLDRCVRMSDGNALDIYVDAAIDSARKART